MSDQGDEGWGVDDDSDASGEDERADLPPSSRDDDTEPARERTGEGDDADGRPAPRLDGPAPARSRESGDDGPQDRWSGSAGVAPAPPATDRQSGDRGRGESMDPTDPVKERWKGRVDLYDIATWEVRSPLDSLAVGMSNTLSASRNWVLIVSALVLFAAQMVIAGALVLEQPALALLTGLSIVPALVLAGYIWYGDPTTREPFVLLAVTFILSMLLASVAALVNDSFVGLFETAGVIGLLGFYFVVVGPIEELVKWVAIRAYAYKSEVFRTVADGAVYGAAAGLGFAAIENFIYIGLAYGGTPPAGLSQSGYAAFAAGQRAFAGPGHVIFSAWAGFYLGLAKFNPENRGPIVVKGLLIAIFIHALYNSLVTVLPLTFLLLLGFIVIYHGFWFWLLYRKISSYRSLYNDIDSPTPPGEHPPRG